MLQSSTTLHTEPAHGSLSLPMCIKHREGRHPCVGEMDQRMGYLETGCGLETRGAAWQGLCHITGWLFPDGERLDFQRTERKNIHKVGI